MQKERFTSMQFARIEKRPVEEPTAIDSPISGSSQAVFAQHCSRICPAFVWLKPLTRQVVSQMNTTRKDAGQKKSVVV
jgi:hypothetical protein